MGTNYTFKYTWVILLVAVSITLYGLIPSKVNLTTPWDAEIKPTMDNIMNLKSQIRLPIWELRAMTFNQLQQATFKGQGTNYRAIVYKAKKPKYSKLKEIEVEYDNLEPIDRRLQLLGIEEYTQGLYLGSILGIDYVVEIICTDYEEVRNGH